MAIAVLEQAFRDADVEPMPQTPATRLAIGTLLRLRIAEIHQAERFVEAMTTSLDMPGTVAGYMRHTYMDQMLEAWRREIRRRDRDA